MDFAKAFDKVPHKRLLYKLHWYGVRGSIHHWIQSFLSNRTQRVIIHGTLSSPVSVTSGVPQGTVLGPLLFLVYINNLSDHMKHSLLDYLQMIVFYTDISNVIIIRSSYKRILIHSMLGPLHGKWSLTQINVVS